mgnify:CR=1 FL=1
MHNNEPIWFNKEEPNKIEISVDNKTKYKIIVKKTCHSEEYIHNCQSEWMVEKT